MFLLVLILVARLFFPFAPLPYPIKDTGAEGMADPRRPDKRDFFFNLVRHNRLVKRVIVIRMKYVW